MWSKVLEEEVFKGVGSEDGEVGGEAWVGVMVFEVG